MPGSFGQYIWDNTSLFLSKNENKSKAPEFLIYMVFFLFFKLMRHIFFFFPSLSSTCMLLLLWTECVAQWLGKSLACMRSWALRPSSAQNESEFVLVNLTVFWIQQQCEKLLVQGILYFKRQRQHCETFSKDGLERQRSVIVRPRHYHLEVHSLWNLFIRASVPWEHSACSLLQVEMRGSACL